MNQTELESPDVLSPETGGEPPAQPVVPDPSPPNLESEAAAGDIGRARDAQGRFLPSSKAAEAPDEVAPPVTPEGQEAGAPPEAVVDATVLPEGEPKASPPTFATPYAVRFAGRDYTIPEAGFTDDGQLVVKSGSVELISTYIGRGMKYEVEVPKLRSEVEKLREEAKARNGFNDEVTQSLLEMLDLPSDERDAALENLRASLPVLMERERANALEKQLQERERALQPDPREQHSQRVAAFEHTFDEVFSEAIGKQSVLTKQEQDELREELREIRDSFVVIAPADDPNEGIQKGEWLFHEPRMQSLIARRVSQVQRLREEAKKVASATARNAATLSPTPPKAPPLAPQKTPAAPPAPAAQPKVASRQDALESWEKKLERLARGA